jgi:hypothetical protein
LGLHHRPTKRCSRSFRPRSRVQPGFTVNTPDTFNWFRCRRSEALTCTNAADLSRSQPPSEVRQARLGREGPPLHLQGKAHPPAPGEALMGFLSRLLVRQSVRRATHPVRTVRRAVTPKSVKRARRALHPVSSCDVAADRPGRSTVGRPTPEPHHRARCLHHRYRRDLKSRCSAQSAISDRRALPVVPPPSSAHTDSSSSCLPRDATVRAHPAHPKLSAAACSAILHADR